MLANHNRASSSTRGRLEAVCGGLAVLVLCVLLEGRLLGGALECLEADLALDRLCCGILVISLLVY